MEGGGLMQRGNRKLGSGEREQRWSWRRVESVGLVADCSRMSTEGSRLKSRKRLRQEGSSRGEM